MDVTVSSRLPLLAADDGYLQQAITYMLYNAIQLSPVDCIITIILETMATGMRLTIRDQGPGIPEEELNWIFGRFTQSSRTYSNAGGTGFGLAIWQEIITAHGGLVSAANMLKVVPSLLWTFRSIKQK